ncbi:MAG: hypothetical protein AAF938_08250 [Myxococcota bacterium]
MHHMRTWVTRTYGDDAWHELLHSMVTPDRRELEALVPVGWYPLALQHRLLRAIDRHVGRDDGALVDTIGEYEADQDLTVVHRLFLRLANPAFVLEKAGDYWSRFYTAGRWEVQRESPTSARARLSDVEPWDPIFGRYLKAYIHRMWVLVGAKEVHIDSRDMGDGLRLIGRWS